MIGRVETKYLFKENVSPYVKSLILKKRAGIPLNENETKRLNSFSEAVSIITPQPYHTRIVTPQKIGSFHPEENEEEEEMDLQDIIDELELEMMLDEILNEFEEEEIIDLDEILAEMGYSK